MHSSPYHYAQSKVLVVGGLILDSYWYGKCDRLSREAPVPVLVEKEKEQRAGGAANVALNLAGLGVQTYMCGVVGKDKAGRNLLDLLKKQRVNCDAVHVVPDRKTMVKLRIMSQNQQLLRMDSPNTATAARPELFESIKPLLEDIDVMIISDYYQIDSTPAIADLIKLARDKNIKVIIDPTSANSMHYRGASLLTPNLEEFENMVGPCGGDETILVERGLALIKKLGLDALLVTRGSQGMSLLRATCAPFHLSAEKKEIYDVTGAGDTVIATIAAMLSIDQDLDEAVRLANFAAGLTVSRLGAVAVDVAMLGNYGTKNAEMIRGIVNEKQLSVELKNARDRDERIVMTNGCFDIVHAGHVVSIEQAAALGDCLVVAVNSDDSVRRLKGNDRPVNTLQQRMSLLAALKHVDWVISFSEDTPAKLIHLIKPDVLAKGGDYVRADLSDGDIVEEYGGRVQILDKVPMISTSAIIDKVRKA